MYTITRQEASDILAISVRSIDRYTKSGKLRAKKKGKTIYINADDIEKMKTGGIEGQEIIIGGIPEQDNSNHATENFNFIYLDLKEEIARKDSKIEDLSIQLGTMKEILKNSVSAIEYRKSQYLLEQSKDSIEKELNNSKQELENKILQLKDEKSINTILIIISFVLFLLLVTIWFTGV